MLGAIELDGRRPRPMTTAALGTGVSNDAARALASELGIPHSSPDDVLGETAGLIAAGEIVAFVRGRFEWGPRALGQRSILAAPQEEAMREKLNRAVKKREPFRPFAPAVVDRAAGQWFTGHDNDMAPYMTTIGWVRPNPASKLGAITHVDGTARVQTVSARSAPDFHYLLDQLEKRNGVPISLNTSLNGNGEPIVATEADAVGFFASHPVDAMVIGDVLLRRKRS
jgi:carbamoyltransferase